MPSREDNVGPLMRLTRNVNAMTSITMMLSVVLLLIGGIAYFTGANTNIIDLMNGVSIAAMVIAILAAVVLFYVYWFRNTSSLGLDGFLVVGLMQNRAGQAFVASILVFVASFQIYTTARMTPVG